MGELGGDGGADASDVWGRGGLGQNPRENVNWLQITSGDEAKNLLLGGGVASLSSRTALTNPSPSSTGHGAGRKTPEPRVVQEWVAETREVPRSHGM